MVSHVDKDFLDVSGILEPKSVAVIGASDRPGNLGGDTVRRLTKFGFPGPVWPVNPKGATHPKWATVAGRKCFSSISALPEVPDLVILAVPAAALIGSIEECARLGVAYGIAYAGGLAEAGGEGVALQHALTSVCRQNGFKLCGPNCVGVINAILPATSTFSTALVEMEALRAGVISILGQSGGICTTALSMIQHAGFGTRHMISSGNEAVVSFADYLYALARDPGTAVIAGYLEGVQDGPKFVRALEEARTQNKSVVMIKAGTTGVSAQAAMAHTGALVGEDRVFDAIFNEMGVVRVSSVEELVDVSLTLVPTRRKRPALGGVGIVTFGGGNGVLAADHCAAYGLDTPPLSDECVKRLQPLLVSVATSANPLDLTPTTAFRQESLAQLPEALDVVAAEPEIHSVLLIAGSLASKAAEISDVMLGLAGRTDKPVFVCWPSPPRGVTERFASEGIFTFLDPERAVRAISRLESRAAALTRPARPASTELASFDWASWVPDTDSQLVVPEHQCHRILDAARLPVAAGQLVRNEATALQAAESIGLPVALKGISAEVTHRASVGLVAVDLYRLEDVKAAFHDIHARARQISIELEGIYVQKLHPGGIELLVTAFRDPLFGTMVTCGAGGRWAELIDDVVTERAPLDRELATHMLERLRIGRNATDRGGSPDTDSAARFIARFSELAATAPWDRFILEINPVKWTREEVVALDGLLIVNCDRATS
jgi:acyl-CoA synthetase (NDP forming)